MASETIIFMHIPKTGGKTLNSILRNQYTPTSFLGWFGSNQRAEEALKKLSSAELTEAKCISGHLGFGIHKYLITPYKYITLLRDPVERVISTYSFVQSRQTPFLQKLWGKTLEEFLDAGIVQLHNLQTRYVLGLVERVTRVLDSDDYQDAVKILEKEFTILGITELFDRSIELMAERFGWQNNDFQKENITRNRLKQDQVSAKTLNLIKEKNRIDLQLYELARERLELVR